MAHDTHKGTAHGGTARSRPHTPHVSTPAVVPVEPGIWVQQSNAGNATAKQSELIAEQTAEQTTVHNHGITTRVLTEQLCDHLQQYSPLPVVDAMADALTVYLVELQAGQPGSSQATYAALSNLIDAAREAGHALRQELTPTAQPMDLDQWLDSLRTLLTDSLRHRR